MLQRGYFEISQWSGTAFGLNILAMVGNMIYNQRHWQNGVEILAPLAGPLQIELEEQTFQLELCALYWADNHPTPPHTSVEDRHWYRARVLLFQVLEILSSFSRETPVIAFREASSDLFVQCVKYVRQHCAEKLSAEIVAHAVGYSASSVYRLFKQYTGVSFNEYLHTIRIHMACGLLQQNQYSVTEISWMCGFTSSSSFYRCFQQMLGITLVQYRRTYHSFSTNASAAQDKLLHYNSYQAFAQLPFQ